MSSLPQVLPMSRFSSLLSLGISLPAYASDMLTIHDVQERTLRNAQERAPACTRDMATSAIALHPTNVPSAAGIMMPIPMTFPIAITVTVSMAPGTGECRYCDGSWC